MSNNTIWDRVIDRQMEAMAWMDDAEKNIRLAREEVAIARAIMLGGNVESRQALRTNGKAA